NTEQNNQNAQPSAPGTTDQAGATVKPSTTPNQDAEVKPNPDQTATGTPAGTDNQNTQQGNTEQNNQNAQPSAPGTTDQ
ncbi:YSIRK-type signal peptide-containing protein, partial [Staphylococcus epidermidis]